MFGHRDAVILLAGILYWLVISSEAGADMNVTDYCGKSPYEVANEATKHIIMSNCSLDVS